MRRGDKRLAVRQPGEEHRLPFLTVGLLIRASMSPIPHSASRIPRRVVPWEYLARGTVGASRGVRLNVENHRHSRAYLRNFHQPAYHAANSWPQGLMRRGGFHADAISGTLER